MYRLQKTVYKRDNPSFSSTLLDKIYRSIDDGDSTNGDLKFYRETMQKKQSKGTVKCNKSRGYGEEEDEEMSSLRQACLIEKWMEKKVNDHGLVFFSSTSASSDSSSGGFSSSDTESMRVTKSKSSCFVTSRPKPVRTGVSIRSEKPGRTDRALLYEQESHMFHETLFRSKSRAAKIYSNLKKAKQPISPGGKLAGFINSLFTRRQTPSSTVTESGQVSTCSSASSFSRSCLSKNSPSTRERLRNGVKRTVRFCPVSVIVDEDCRPCGQKCLYQLDSSSSVSKIRKPPSRKIEDDAASYSSYSSNNVTDNMDEDEDDAASYSSSDLFELDHLVLVGNNSRYREELPVYETTHVETNRAIANGLIS
ncbi:BIG GRAIN 4 [Hibiscus trionum]|uniref:BIG GRAIN 4 n=1 Tax=Hibiscus trionum TaxID=183268 RepID=A0A9W7HSW8_HIBTR|nr:BIG GRAIN 4 [Hibiscus trionum]